MKKREKLFMLISLGPAVLCFLVMFAYPIIRTVMMSLNQLPSISSDMADWKFVRLRNYTELFRNSVFLASLRNIGKIWLIGGILTLSVALFFAVILASGVKGKRFWRSAIYLPNSISAVALSTMWLQYVFQNKFGMLKQLFGTLGMEKLEEINWTSPQYLFWAMLLSSLWKRGLFHADFPVRD
ncbi:MAG: carbohydrate ABC transporter permease [Eisenbergiella massiliensis]